MLAFCFKTIEIEPYICMCLDKLAPKDGYINTCVFAISSLSRLCVVVTKIFWAQGLSRHYK